MIQFLYRGQWGDNTSVNIGSVVVCQLYLLHVIISLQSTMHQEVVYFILHFKLTLEYSLFW